MTHVVTGLKTLGARGVLEGLGVVAPGEKEPPPSAADFAIVTPDWLIACFQQQRLVYIKPYELPSESSAPASGPAPTAADGKARPHPPSPAPPGGSPTGKRSGPQLAPPLRMPAEIEALLDEHFPDLDPETRAAYIAWGGPLDIRVGKDMPRYACQRPTPRQHPNQRLTRVLEEIEDFYYATGDRERATSFGRALGVLRAWPRRIKDAKEVKGAPYIGEVCCAPARASGLALCVNMLDLTTDHPSITRTEHDEGGGAGPGARHHRPPRGAPEGRARQRPPGPVPPAPGILCM